MVLGVYQHYKGGIYHFVGTAKHTETGEKLAIYVDSKGRTWARPFDMFHGDVEIEGEFVQRFKLILIPKHDEVKK